MSENNEKKTIECEVLFKEVEKSAFSYKQNPMTNIVKWSMEKLSKLNRNTVKDGAETKTKTVQLVYNVYAEALEAYDNISALKYTMDYNRGLPRSLDHIEMYNILKQVNKKIGNNYTAEQYMKEMREIIDQGSSIVTDDNTTIAELQAQLAEANKMIADMEANINGYDKEIADLESQLAEANKTIADMETHINGDDKELADLESRVEMSAEEDKKLKECLESITEKYNTVKAENEELLSEKEMLTKQVQELQEKCKSLEQDIKGTRDKVNSIHNTVRETVESPEVAKVIGNIAPVQKAVEDVANNVKTVSGDTAKKEKAPMVKDLKPWDAYGVKKTTYYKYRSEGRLAELKAKMEALGVVVTATEEQMKADEEKARESKR